MSSSTWDISGTPIVWRNFSNTSQFGVAPGQLSLHPGPRRDGHSAILRFKPPKPGLFKVTGRYSAGDSGVMNGRVVLNGNFAKPRQVFDVADETAALEKAVP